MPRCSDNIEYYKMIHLDNKNELNIEHQIVRNAMRTVGRCNSSSLASKLGE